MSVRAGWLSILQLAYTGFSAAALGRVLPRKPFASWLADNFSFNYYIPPSNEELRALVRPSPGAVPTSSGDDGGGGGGGSAARKAKQRRKPHTGQLPNEGDFSIPTSTLDRLELRKAKLLASDFKLFFNQDDLEWLIDLSTMTFFNFVVHEVFLSVLADEHTVNISQMWLVLVILFCILNLARVTKTYFTKDNGSEAAICLTSFLIFIFVALLVQEVEESELEFGIETAYRSFNKTTTAFLEARTNVTDDVLTKLTPIPLSQIKIGLVFGSAIMGLFLTFPAFRYAQMYITLRMNPSASWQLKNLALFTFLAPLIIVLFWYKPCSRELWTNVFGAADSTFESNRIWFIVFTNFLKFSAIMHYSNAYLETAQTRLMKMKRLGGSTSSKDIQQMFTAVYAFINVVLIQYLGPIMLTFALTFLYKSLGGVYWIPPEWNPSNLAVEYVFPPDAQRASYQRSFFASADLVLPEYEFANNQTAQELFVQTIQGQFNQTLFQGILGYYIWWINLVWFLTTASGVLVHRFFMV